MMRSWTLARRLGLSFAVVVSLAVLLGVSAVGSLGVLRRASEKMRGESEDLVEAKHLEAVVEQEVADTQGYLLTRDEATLKNLHDLDAQVDALVAQRMERLGNTDGRRLMEEVRLADNELGAAFDAFIAAHKNDAGARDAARYMQEMGASLQREEGPRVLRLRSAIGAYEAYERQGLKEEDQAFVRTANRTSAWLLGLTALAIAGGVVLGIFFTRAITQQIGAAVHDVQSSSAELQAAATQQATASKEQAAATNETSTTIKELVATARQIADGSQRVAQIADRASAAAKSGDQAARRAHGALGMIKQQVESLVNHTLELGKRSQQIGGILEIINELSEQTNILAINATIEAAGAGESGKRFAVVADEIRKLADRVGGSARDIQRLIEEVRASVNGTVMATEQGSKAVDTGVRQVEELAAAFGEIAGMAGTTTEAAREIELSTRQQTSAVEQVNLAMADVTQAAKETEATAGQVFETASQLASLSKTLNRMIRADARG
jgi:methyl-accepting chemotaxis protein